VAAVALSAMPLYGEQARRRRLLAGVALLGVSQAVAWRYSALVGLFVSQGLVGVAHTVILVDAEALLGAASRPEAVAGAVGWYSTLVALGQTVGPLVGGVLLDVAGAAAVFAFGAVAGLASAVLLARVGGAASGQGRAGWGSWPSRAGSASPGSPASPANQASSRASGQARRTSSPANRVSRRELFRSPAVRVAATVTFCGAAIHAARQSFYPSLAYRFGASGAFVGVLLGIQGIMGLVARPMLPLLVRSAQGASRLGALSLAVGALAFALTPLARHPVAMVLVAVLTGCSVGVTIPAGITVLAGNVKEPLRSSAVAWRLVSNRVAQSVVPAALGALASVTSLDWAFYACAALLAAGTVMVVLDEAGLRRGAAAGL